MEKERELTPVQEAFVRALQATAEGKRVNDADARILNEKGVIQTNRDTVRDESSKDKVTPSA